MPVPDVELNVGNATARTDANGSATLHVGKTDADNSNDDATLTASLNGLTQDIKLRQLVNWRPSVKVSTDKRLYRPEQTLHMRVAALGRDGHATSEEACTIEVTNQRGGTLTPEPNGLVRCDVVADRPSFRGFGMMIAEVGIPPASEIDRAAMAELQERALLINLKCSRIAWSSTYGRRRNK